MKKYAVWSFLVGVFLLWAVFLRLYDLNHQSLWMDEAFSVNAAQEIIEKGEPLLDSGIYYNRAYAFHYVLAGFMLIDDSQFFLRLPSVIFSLLAIAAVFLTVRKMFPKHKEIAFFTVIIMGLAYWDVAWARQVRMYSMFSFLTWLSIYLALPGVRLNKLLKFLLLLGLFVLLYDTQKLALILLPILLMLYSENFSFIRDLLKKYARVFLIAFYALFLVLLVGTAIYQLLFAYPLYGFWMISSMPFFIIGVILVGLAAILKNQFSRETLWLFLILDTALAILVWYGLQDHMTVSYRYAFFVYPALYILMAIGCFFIFKKHTLLRVVGVFSIISLLVSLNFLPKRVYALESDSFNFKQKYYSYTPQPDWYKAYEYVMHNMQEGDVVISSQAVFSKLYLKRVGYWLTDGRPLPNDAVDFYVGAQALTSEEDLLNVIENKSGFLVFDFYSKDDSVAFKFEKFLNKMQLVYKDQGINQWSEILVYRFGY